MVRFVFLGREGEEMNSPKYPFVSSVPYHNNTVSRNMLDVEQG
jgi:hypothetical protein